MNNFFFKFCLIKEEENGDSEDYIYDFFWYSAESNQYLNNLNFCHYGKIPELIYMTHAPTSLQIWILVYIEKILSCSSEMIMMIIMSGGHVYK